MLGSLPLTKHIGTNALAWAPLSLSLTLSLTLRLCVSASLRLCLFACVGWMETAQLGPSTVTLNAQQSSVVTIRVRMEAAGAAVSAAGAFSQTYGSIPTVILHINDVPCWSRGSSSRLRAVVHAARCTHAVR